VAGICIADHALALLKRIAVKIRKPRAPVWQPPSGGSEGKDDFGVDIGSARMMILVWPINQVVLSSLDQIEINPLGNAHHIFPASSSHSRCLEHRVSCLQPAAGY
jgi:hypothetical protein